MIFLTCKLFQCVWAILDVCCYIAKIEFARAVSMHIAVYKHTCSQIPLYFFGSAIKLSIQLIFTLMRTIFYRTHLFIYSIYLWFILRHSHQTGWCRNKAPDSQSRYICFEFRQRYFCLFFFNLCGGTLGTAAITGLLYQPRMIRWRWLWRNWWN
jgi:hypothetical protein